MWIVLLGGFCRNIFATGATLYDADIASILK